jgi:hypothetical protein
MLFFHCCSVVSISCQSSTHPYTHQQAEVMNLRAPIDTKAEGTVIEARVDKGMGVVVTALVQKGSLKIGDYVLAGPSWGKVRRLVSDQRLDLKEAGPSTPVQVRRGVYTRTDHASACIPLTPAPSSLISLLINMTDRRHEYSTKCG